MLFCDIRGFTSMSERLTPEQVVSALNEFYALMFETTFKHDGTLNKFDHAYRDLPLSGRIGLQYHGSPIEFRNLFVERL